MDRMSGVWIWSLDDGELMNEKCHGSAVESILRSFTVFPTSCGMSGPECAFRCAKLWQRMPKQFRVTPAINAQFGTRSLTATRMGPAYSVAVRSMSKYWPSQAPFSDANTSQWDRRVFQTVE